MKITYSSSAMTIEADMVDSRVSECFDNLMRALNKQLDIYRNRK